MNKIKPNCVHSLNQSMEILNTGHLVPCTHMGTPHGYRDPIMVKLMEKTKLSDYNSIEDIISQPEWIQYFENLKKNIGPEACFYYCNATNNIRGEHSKIIEIAAI